jgi:hypothetical protein
MLASCDGVNVFDRLYRYLAGGRMNITTSRLGTTSQRLAMILTHATSLFGLLHPIASIVSQGGPPE